MNRQQLSAAVQKATAQAIEENNATRGRQLATMFENLAGMLRGTFGYAARPEGPAKTAYNKMLRERAQLEAPISKTADPAPKQKVVRNDPEDEMFFLGKCSKCDYTDPTTRVPIAARAEDVAVCHEHGPAGKARAFNKTKGYWADDGTPFAG